MEGLEAEGEETVADPGDFGGDAGDQAGVVGGAQRGWQHAPGVGLDLDVIGDRVSAAHQSGQGRLEVARLALVGAGHMAEGTLATCNEIFDWEEVRVWSRSQATLDHFMRTQQPKFPQLRIRPSTDLEQAVRGADVVVTVTPARGPIVMDEWIAPGTHIAAIGADKGGDQELDPKILQRARIFVDDIRQCRTDGEINVPLRQGLLKESDIAGEIGEIITGKKPGRTSDAEITLFDSTGIALQDSATVPLEYERAVAAGVGVEKKMIST